MNNQKSSSFQPILNDVTKSGLGVVLSFILSTSLIGGSSFVIFEFPGQLFALNQRSAEVNALQAEIPRFTEMLKVPWKGWISNPANITLLINIFKSLEANIEPQTLDDATLSADLFTCHQQAYLLMIERGKVRGYTFTMNRYKTIQSAAETRYDSYIRYIFALQDALVSWKASTSAEHRQRLLQINRSVLELSEADALLNVQSNLTTTVPIGDKKEQSDFAAITTEGDKDELTAQNERLNIETATLVTRFTLSVLGIVVGGFMLVLLLVNFGRQLRRDVRRDDAPAV